jgi:RimJ/RimL family protein N-acetyltransferase
MSASTLRVRPATGRDLYCLWLWANDPETRRASFGRETIPWSDHVAWFERQRCDEAPILIAETTERQPIGSVRFDTSDGWRTSRLSYVVAPEARQQGWSRPLVTQGVQHFRLLRPKVTITARVMAGNVGSLQVFRGLGWNESVEGRDHLFVQPSDESHI